MQNSQKAMETSFHWELNLYHIFILYFPYMYMVQKLVMMDPITTNTFLTIYYFVE